MDSLRPEIRTPSDPKELTDPDADLKRSGIRSLVTVRRVRVLDVVVSALAGTLTISLYIHLAPVVAHALDISPGLRLDVPVSLFLAGLASGLTFLLLRRYSTRH
jgi:hypothetical protein